MSSNSVAIERKCSENAAAPEKDVSETKLQNPPRKSEAYKNETQNCGWPFVKCVKHISE